MTTDATWTACIGASNVGLVDPQVVVFWYIVDGCFAKLYHEGLRVLGVTGSHHD